MMSKLMIFKSSRNKQPLWSKGVGWEVFGDACFQGLRWQCPHTTGVTWHGAGYDRLLGHLNTPQKEELPCSHKSGGIRALNIQVKTTPPAPRTTHTHTHTHTPHIESRHWLVSMSLHLLHLSSQFSCEMFLPPGKSDLPWLSWKQECHHNVLCAVSFLWKPGRINTSDAECWSPF